MMVAMNAQPNTIADNSASRLQSLLEQALFSPTQQRDLLRQPEALGEILNSISARRWLFEVSRQNDRNRAIKARSLIILIMQHSGAIWRGSTAPEDYVEALARAWKWFSERLNDYDPTQASFVTWFNNKLKFLILDVIEEKKAREQREQPLESGEDAQSIVVPDPRPSVVVAQIFYEQVVDLVQRDPGHNLRRCYMHNNLHVTCQKVISAILQSQPVSPNIPWERLSHQFEVDPVSFRNFCNDTAFPRFRQFCQQHGIYHL